jgi:ribosome-binding protein aMBF1 (putative translation factor)
MATKTLGETIRELREKTDFSLRELAKKLDVSAPFLSDVELGHRYPSDEVMAKLAKALRVPMEELKRHDHRGSISDLKRMIETNPGLGFAFRTAVDDVKQGKLSPEELAQRLKKSSKS